MSAPGTAVGTRAVTPLLDEPAVALDPAGRREVLDGVGGLSGRSTVVLIVVLVPWSIARLDRGEA